MFELERQYKNVYGVYVIRCLVNDFRYIGGGHLGSRFRTHKSRLNLGKHIRKLLQEHWNLYGQNNFVFEVIEVCDQETVKNKEQYWLDFYNSIEPNGYNRATNTKGGSGPLTNEEKDHLSEILTGKKGSNLGKRFSDETKRKMSESAKGKKIPDHQKVMTSERQKEVWGERKQLLSIMNNLKNLDLDESFEFIFNEKKFNIKRV